MKTNPQPPLQTKLDEIGLKLTELSKLSGISRAMLYQMRKGLRPISPENAIKLDKAHPDLLAEELLPEFFSQLVSIGYQRNK